MKIHTTLPKVFLTASAVTLLAAGALAQTSVVPKTSEKPTVSTSTSTSPGAVTHQLDAGDVLSSKLVGAKIYGLKANASASSEPKVTNIAPTSSASSTAGTTPAYVLRYEPITKAEWAKMKDEHESIGEIENLVIGSDGHVKLAVAGVGGFLGVGEKHVALDLTRLHLMRDEDGGIYVVAHVTRDELKAAPEFKTEKAS